MAEESVIVEAEGGTTTFGDAPDALHGRDYRVAMSDTDAAGIIFFAQPYVWVEASISAWLAELGHPISAMLRAGEACPTVGSQARYVSPLRVDDVVRITLHLDRVGTSSFRLRYDVRRQSDGSLAVQVHCDYVWVRIIDGQAGDPGGFTTRPLPAWLREALEARG